MLAANPDLQFPVCLAPALDRDSHQLADSDRIELRERVLLVNSSTNVVGEEFPRVIARDSIRHLRQIVGPERKEFRDRADLIRNHARARHFDHRADREWHLDAAFLEHRGGHFANLRRQNVEFLALADQRQHDFGHRLDAFLAQLARRLENRARLRLVNLGEADSQPRAAMPQHRIDLEQALAHLLQMLERSADFGGQVAQLAVGMREKFMQRRIQQTDRDRQSRHRFQDSDEVLALHRQDLFKRAPALLRILRHDHFAHGRDSLGIEKHVFGAAQPDSFGAEFARDLGVVGSVGVGAHSQLAYRVRPRQKFLEERRHLGIDRRHPALDHFA